MSIFILPEDNINISLIGAISTGKSTILNSIFCEKLTQCKIKRTTMIPTIYVENPKNTTLSEEIYKIIEDKNTELIEKSKNIIFENDYDELIFNVGKLDIDILDDAFVNVYDIPGLNDIRTKKLYYKYLEKNFHKFNIIIFVIDIYSGLNTSDESDILKLIIDNTKLNKDKKIYTMVIVNKADDMLLDSQDKLILSGELLEMFEQVENTIQNEFEKNNLKEHLISIIPLCSMDAYLYRMIKKFSQDYILTPEEILKIGINENGKKNFCKLSFEDQVSKVYDITRDTEFIDTMIKLSGFANFENILSNFLNKDNHSNHIRIENLLFELKKLDNINEYYNFFDNIYLDDKINKLIDKHFITYNIIKNIDNKEFRKIINYITNDLFRSIQEKMKKYDYNNIPKLITEYANFQNFILKIYFQDFCDTSSYPIFFKEYIYSLIINKYSENNFINIIDIIKDLNILNAINIYSCENITKLFNTIIANDECDLIYKFNEEYNEEYLIKIFDKLYDLKVNLDDFLRYIIIYKIKEDFVNDNHNLLFIKKMLYNKYNEIPIYNYISLIRIKVDRNTVVRGLKDSIIFNLPLNLDLYYLKFIQKFIDV